MTNQNEKISLIELKTGFLLAGIYASRMLGLFLIFPTFSVLATTLDNTTTAKIGLALGIYGLAQALLQIPAGILSDMIGRKKVLYIGLSLFLIGSLLATLTNDINVLIVARLLQGSGAVSAVCLAYVADSIRPVQHGKVMAIIGISIALSFVLSFIIGPVISHHYGLQGLFAVISMLACFSILFTILLKPVTHSCNVFKIKDFLNIVKNKSLIVLNLQIALLHMMLSASFFLLPILVDIHFTNSITSLYIPSILIAFILVMPLIRKSQLIEKLMPFEWALLAIAFLFFSLSFVYSNRLVFSIIMTLFFFAFTYIEANLPSLLFKKAKGEPKGACSGVYSVYQYVGSFLGGVIGANLYGYFKSNGNIQSSFYIFMIIAAVVAISYLVKGKGKGWQAEA